MRSVWKQGGRGYWAAYYTSPQSFMIRFSYLFNNFGDFFWFLICWLIKLSVQTLLSLILQKAGNLVYHHWWCTSIYQTMPYPFRSLVWKWNKRWQVLTELGEISNLKYFFMRINNLTSQLVNIISLCLYACTKLIHIHGSITIQTL